MPVTALDLTDPDSFVGGPPHDFYTYLRNEAPVYWHPSTTLLEPGFWVLTRYADIIATERDVATFSSAAHGALMESQEGSGSEMHGIETQIAALLFPSAHRHDRFAA